MTNTDSDLGAHIQVDAICEEYEALFKQGASPRIEDFLDRVQPENRSKLIHELVAVDVELRCSQGERLSTEDLLNRYAGLLPAGEDREALRSTIEEAVGTGRQGDPAATVSWDGPVPAPAKTPFPHIAGFQIESVLGRGGMGIVFKASQTSLKRPVALKMILDPAGASAEHFARFEKEARAVAELNDPHFVQIYEFGQAGGQPYMALEFVEGGSLEQYRQGEPQPAEFTAQTVETLARAMHKAHAAGLVHRDLKPHNVLLTGDGQPKIADFGLVKRQIPDESQMTQHGAVVGTASYMAPEQTHSPNVGPAADIYSLGGILYCLLTARPPFLAATTQDTILQVRHADPVPPSRLRPGIPRDLETICLKCLEKETHKRYGTSQDLADDLRRYQEGRPIVARPVSAVERGWRWAKRNPWVAGLGTTAAAALVTVAMVFSVMSWQLSKKTEQLTNSNDQLTNSNDQLQKRTAEALFNFQQAEIARRQEEVERQNAEAARDVARKQKHTSLEVVHDVLYYVDNQLRKDPGKVKERESIINTTLTSLQRIRELGEANPLGDRDEAIGLQRLGQAYEAAGRLKDAMQLYNQAQGILELLGLQDPDRAIHQSNLGAIYHERAEKLERLGNTLEARDDYAKALQARQRWAELTERESDHYGGERAVANSYYSLGRVNFKLGDPQTALENYNQALEWFGKIPPTYLREPVLDRELGGFLQRLGEAYYHCGNHARAEKMLLSSQDKRAGLAAKDPSIRRDVDLSRMALGDFFMSGKKDLPAAWDRYRHVISEFQSSWQSAPNTVHTRNDLAAIEYRIGALLLRAGKASVTLEGIPEGDTPQAHFQRSCELREELAKIDQDDMQARLEWALALARCGRAAEAQQEAKLLEEKGQGNPRLLFQAACIFALASETDDSELAARCREQAMAVLKRLINAGWKDYVALHDDPDLDPLQGDPDFAEFLVVSRSSITP